MSDCNKASKQKLWIECEGLDELADWIDAVPAEFRTTILSAALSFHADDDLSSSYVVGIYRSRLFDCAYSFCGLALGPQVVEQFPPQGLEVFCLSWTLSEIDELEYSSPPGDHDVQPQAVFPRAKGFDRSSPLA